MTGVDPPRKRPRGRPPKNDRWLDGGQDLHEQRRDAVMRTAAREFARNGYYGTSLDRLAELLNVTKPSLYHYIKDKDEILFESNRQALMMVKPAIRELRESKLSGLERLIALAPAWARMTTSDFGICLLTTGLRPLRPKSRAILETHMQELDEAVTDIIRAGIGDGSIRDCNPRLTAFAVISALNGMSTWFKRDGSMTAEQVADIFADLFANGFAPRNA